MFTPLGYLLYVEYIMQIICLMWWKESTCCLTDLCYLVNPDYLSNVNMEQDISSYKCVIQITFDVNKG
jgi:hypothetical protein